MPLHHGLATGAAGFFAGGRGLAIGGASNTINRNAVMIRAYARNCAFAVVL
jgi:hypothetical protein